MSDKKTVKPKSKLYLFIHSKSFPRLCGICMMLFAVFMVISMLSFLLHNGAESNAMGALGWLTAFVLTNRLFGIASLGLAALLFLFGFTLVRKVKVRWWRVLGITFFWMIWISTVIGYVRVAWLGTTRLEHLSGIGATIAERLSYLLNWGTLIFLIMLAVVFLVYVHHVHFHIPENLFARADKNDDIDPADDNATNREPFLKRLLSGIAGLLHKKDDDDDEEEETDDDNPPADPPTPPATNDDDSPDGPIPFDIDEEFDRINQQARGEQPQGGEPTFEILPTADDNADPQHPTADDNDDPDELAHNYEQGELYDPYLELKDYEFPSTSLLTNWEEKNEKISREELIANKDRIVKTLRDYSIEITDISASPGPTVTLYEIKPTAGTRIARIKSLEDDIALSLSAIGIRIIAPIPGKGTIGIEVPNAKPQVVSMKTMLESAAFRNSDRMQLPVAIGKTISNEPYVTDLAKMPHLLMAGATGTGKSVGLNAVIASLLYKKHPADLKFVMVDPKKVELSLYSLIERHYLAKLPDSEEAIITDVKKVVRTLNSLCVEMDQRYDLLKLAQVRKITEYNDKFIRRKLSPANGHRYLPYIVLVIDEFADLIMTAGKEVEQPICRLAQLARAVGIHLIIATQRPTTNIITGTIKANFPARIAFKVTSAIDSRTILDTGGAQRLIGRGDMLISLSGSDLVRLQCALIETEEIDAVVKHIANQRGYLEAFQLPEYLDENDEPNKDIDLKQRDECFEDAARLVFATGLASTSLLQRKMTIGFARAGRIIDQLEAAGIVGPPNGSKPRDLLVRDEATLNEILRNL
ncbi:MAG: DNA translocase FtsK [Bacteroidales bacterium]|nr:DNA translocase FtsK [Bacteroidales bacterium]